MGKEEFDAAYNDAKNLLEAETASDEEITACIETLKTTWAGLKIETVTEIAPDGGIANNTGCEGFGSSYTTVSGKRPTIKYTINATGADFRADIEMIYVYAYGYQTASVTEELISGTTLPKGGKNADPNGIVYGEGWNMPSNIPEEERANMNNYLLMPNIGFFNDKFRDLLL